MVWMKGFGKKFGECMVTSLYTMFTEWMVQGQTSCIHLPKFPSAKHFHSYSGHIVSITAMYTVEVTVRLAKGWVIFANLACTYKITCALC